MGKQLLLSSLFIFLSFFLVSEEAWILPFDNTIYSQTEELFINEGIVPPFEEKPLITGELIRHLDLLSTRCKNSDTAKKIQEIIDNLTLPFPYISPILECAMHAGFNSKTDRLHYIQTYDSEESVPVEDKKILDFRSLYDTNAIPSLLYLGFIVNFSGWSMTVQPELRATNSMLLSDYHPLNFPSDFASFDFNFPRRAILTYYNPPVEFRLGRDKLHLGPGKWSTLTLTQYMPYFDYFKFRFFHKWFSLSNYIISLDPTISQIESVYLDDMYENESNPESNASKNGKPYIDRLKHLVLTNFMVTPLPWLFLRYSQFNLVGGRPLEIYDFNPFMVYHNIYKEGTYSVPISFSGTAVPYPGVKLYLEYFLYDLQLGDESVETSNPTAFAYQGGFTLLSTPFFKLGPGRFRLDGEASLTDPWVYGKYYNLRKFTSRIITIESYVGRFWTDYPLGFYLGPDTVEIQLKLSYGVPGEWEAMFHWNMNGMGEIDLYGWGSDNDYTNAGEPGYTETAAPTGIAQWTNNFTFSGYWQLRKNLTFSAWYRFQTVENQYNIEGDNFIYNYVGMNARWKIF